MLANGAWEKKMRNRQLPEQFGANLSQLVDSDIREAIGKSRFIILNSDVYSDDRVKQASYELTLLYGRNLDFGALQSYEPSDEKADRFELPAYNLVMEGQATAVLINPWQCCLIRTREQLALPDNVEGRVLARGWPEASY